jgi:hypothetical protein
MVRQGRVPGRLLATHYCSHLAAQLVEAAEFGKPAGQLEDTEGFFRGPLTLYRRLTQHLQDVLPRIGSTL